MICLRAGRWQHSWTDGRLKCFLFWLCYKRYGKHFSRATIELWMHLGGLLSSQEANVPLCYTSSNSYASFVLSNLPRASITRWLHAARLPFLNCFASVPFLNCFASVKKQKSMHGSTWPVASPPPGNPRDKTSSSGPGSWNCLKRPCPGGRVAGKIGNNFSLFLWSRISLWNMSRYGNLCTGHCITNVSTLIQHHEQVTLCLQVKRRLTEQW